MHTYKHTHSFALYMESKHRQHMQYSVINCTEYKPANTGHYTRHYQYTVHVHTVDMDASSLHLILQLTR